MQCIVDGRVVGYDRIGKGPIALLLHGWGAHRKSLSSVAQLIAGEGFETISVDVPGFGESERPDAAWGLEDFARWVEAFLVKIGVGSVDILVGHSNGGAIAIKLLSSGFKARKLILLGASGVRSREQGRKRILKVISKTGKGATKMLPKQLQRTMRTRWYKAIGSELYDVPGMEETFKKVTAEDMLIDAAMINTPTLLIYGSNDKATPITHAQAYHSVIEGSKLEIIEGAAHYSFIDKPMAVEERIKEFIRA